MKLLGAESLDILQVKKWTKWEWANNALFVVGGAMCALPLLWYLASGPSVSVITQPYELDGIAQRGDHLDIYFDVSKTRDCPTEVTRLLWRWQDFKGKTVRNIVVLGSTPTSITDMGDNAFILSMPVPANMAPGQWYYSSRSVSHCGFLPSLFPTRVTKTVDVPVTITAVNGNLHGDDAPGGGSLLQFGKTLPAPDSKEHKWALR
jgi:hypothetical protein